MESKEDFGTINPTAKTSVLNSVILRGDSIVLSKFVFGYMPWDISLPSESSITVPTSTLPQCIPPFHISKNTPNTNIMTAK